MKYPALLIANYFIEKAHDTGESLTPLKLIKLVYFAYAWYLAISDTPLIDEPIVAWTYGPVIESIYHQYKKFGNEPITGKANFDNETEKNISALKNDEIAIALLNKIWEVYGQYDAIQLANLTHEKDSPWYEAWHNQNGKSIHNFPITDDLIKKYFGPKVQST